MNGLEFSQNYSSQSREDCPKPFTAKSFAVAIAALKVKASTKAATIFVPCALKIDCAGSLQVFTAAGKKRASVAKAKPKLLASTPFFSVRGKKNGNVKAKWTAAGKALARRKRPFLATIKVTSVDPAGKRSSKSKTLTVTP